VIDGRLSDWGDLRQDGVVLHQQLDYACGPAKPVGNSSGIEIPVAPFFDSAGPAE
jgi:hypothetical protein